MQTDIYWSGITVDASDMTSGPALALVGQVEYPYNIRSNVNVFSGLVLIGPDTDATTVDGITIGVANSTFPGHGSFEGNFIQGFRDNIVIGDNVFMMTFRNLHSLDAHRYGLNYVGTTNTGENISIFGGSMSDCINAGGTSVALYVPSTSAGPDIFLYGVSFSYNDYAFDINAGNTSFTSCHFENKTNNVMGKVKYTGGRPSVAVVIRDGVLAHGTLGGGTENANGRPNMFLVDSTTGDRCSFIIDGMRYNGFGKKETEFVRFTGGAYPYISIERVELAASGGAVGRLCDFTNKLYNSGFEVGKTNGWTNSDGTNTVTQDAVVFNNDAAGSSGTKSLKIVGASAGTTTYSQLIRGISPGSKILARGFMRCDALTAGNMTIKLILLAQDETTQVASYTLGTVSSTTAGWVLYGGYYRCPAGTTSARLEIAATGFTGTGYFDDLGVW